MIISDWDRLSLSKRLQTLKAIQLYSFEQNEPLERAPFESMLQHRRGRKFKSKWKKMTTKNQLLQAIRRNCLKCLGNSRIEVENCSMSDCELRPFRFGKDPEPSKRRGKAARDAARK